MPQLRFCSLGSGSSGNATLVESTNKQSTTRVLLDCGMPLKQLEERLRGRGLATQEIDAVFVTHEHSDHVGCVRQLVIQRGIPVWMSRGTYHALGRPQLNDQLNFASDQIPITIGNLVLHPFTVAHDAKEPLQLKIVSGEKAIALLTDLGFIAPHTLEQLKQLDAVILECNHDPVLLSKSRYPSFLKDRISGRYGHLSNQQAAHLLSRIAHPGLKRVVAAHLSIENNTPQLVKAELAAAWPLHEDRVFIADAEQGFDWLEV